MKTAPDSRENPGDEPFVPDLSEGAEIGVYLALLELIDEGLIITGDEYIVDANSAACRLLGRSYRQLAGQALAELFADGHSFLDARERLFIRGEARGTLPLVLPDGRVHDFPYVAAPRLRPGIHAIVLGYERLNSDAAPGAQPRGWPQLLQFQPQIQVRDGALHAVEALVAASGVDAATLAHICRIAASWPHAQDHAPVVSINIAAEQVRAATLPGRVATALAASSLDAGALELSIDARTLALPETEIAPTLLALADMGVRLALDHFGRDPVPLAQLIRYRLGVLKLDAGFAPRIGVHDGDTALVEAIAQMAASMDVRVLARGVRTQEQRDFLLALGCELQQGPFIGAAQDEHAFAGFLSDRIFC
ncbi:MAG: EAL domain-containing protein [Azoarcus sp.]|nr:EAL domain-containing protein [Azoarcus sp.]